MHLYIAAYTLIIGLPKNGNVPTGHHDTYRQEYKWNRARSRLLARLQIVYQRSAPPRMRFDVIKIVKGIPNIQKQSATASSVRTPSHYNTLVFARYVSG